MEPNGGVTPDTPTPGRVGVRPSTGLSDYGLFGSGPILAPVRVGDVGEGHRTLSTHPPCQVFWSGTRGDGGGTTPFTISGPPPSLLVVRTGSVPGVDPGFHSPLWTGPSLSRSGIGSGVTGSVSSRPTSWTAHSGPLPPEGRPDLLEVRGRGRYRSLPTYEMCRQSSSHFTTSWFTNFGRARRRTGLGRDPTLHTRTTPVGVPVPGTVPMSAGHNSFSWNSNSGSASSPYGLSF